MSEKIEKLLKSEKLKVLKPNECGLIFDEKRGLLVGVCNKDGAIQVTLKKRVSEL